jgi:hypothetical protein
MVGEVGDADPVNDKSAKEGHGNGKVGNADPIHDESAEEDHIILSNSYNWIIEGVEELDEEKICRMNAFYALLKKWLRGKEYTSKLRIVHCNCRSDCTKNSCSCKKANRLCSSRCHRNNNKCKNKHDDNVDSGK